MAFGSPRLVVTIVNLLITAGGIGLATTTTGPPRWVGFAVALSGLGSGTLMGSCSQLLPGVKPMARREDD